MGCFYTEAQIIEGKIKSPTGDALPGVTVIADDTLGVISDADGLYQMITSEGTHSLEFKYLSFQTERRSLSIAAGETLKLDITLKPEARQLDIVVISAGRFEQKLEDVTVSMEVIKPDFIQSRNSIAMDEAVDQIPGVSIVDGQANIRGGSGWSYGAGSRVQILVDDLPQLTADAGDAKWNFLPVENVEQVEIIKGASSVLFGSSALNGVINVRTGFPRDTPLTKANVFSGFYDDAFITTDKRYSLSYRDSPSFFHGINFYHSRKIKRLDLVAGGNGFYDNGYRQGENEKRMRLNLNSKYNFQTPGLSAGINVNFMVTDATIFFLWKNDTSGAYIPADNTLSDSKTYRTSIDPFITYTGKKNNSHKFRSRWFNTTNTNNTNQDSRGDLIYAEYQYQKKLSGGLTLTAGLVHAFSIVRSQLYNDHDGNQSAGYIQADYQLGRLSLSAGGRAEQNQVDEITDELTPVFRSGINYRLFRSTHFRASVGQGYRFPSTAERFVRTSINGVNIFPNEKLEPEKGLSLEAGLKQGFSIGQWKGYADAAFFINEYKNMMEFAFAQWGNDPNPLNNFGFRSVNVGNTRIRGFEVSILGEGKIGDLRSRVYAGYTYLDPKQITYDSLYTAQIGIANIRGSDSTDFLKYRSRHMVKADMEIGWKKYSVGVALRYTSRIENIDRIFIGGLLDFLFPPGLGIGDYRRYHTRGDMIVDLRLTREIKCAHVSFIVKNAFNHIYMQRPADMQPPRTFTLQAGVKF